MTSDPRIARLVDLLPTLLFTTWACLMGIAWSLTLFVFFK